MLKPMDIAGKSQPKVKRRLEIPPEIILAACATVWVPQVVPTAAELDVCLDGSSSGEIKPEIGDTSVLWWGFKCTKIILLFLWVWFGFSSNAHRNTFSKLCVK